MKKILIYFIFLATFSAWSFVPSKADNGDNIKWNRLGQRLTLFYNMSPVNENMTLDATDEEIQNLRLTKEEYIEQKSEEILYTSVRQWQPHVTYDIALRPSSNLGSVGSGENTVRYSTDPRFFGTGGGVIGVTSISFDSDSGNILSADILLNQRVGGTTLTLDKTISSYTNAFIGDVLTHELGHFFGLSHSEVIGSSMVFAVFKGQHIAHPDDIGGVKKIYNRVDANTGSISGRVVADQDAKSIFGVNVNLFSIKQNRIVQSQLSDNDGRFFFENLEFNDSYYIRLEPLKKTEDISPYYKNINNTLCGTKKFKGTFFTKCGWSSKGRPQIFALNWEEDYIDLGDLTIKCDENVAPYYYANKLKAEERQTEILDWGEESGVYYGFFGFEELSQSLTGKGDEFTLDIRNLNYGNNNLSNLTLRLGVITSGLGSNFDVRILTKKINDLEWVTHNSTIDSTGKVITDRFIDLNLSLNPEDNMFEIKVLPIPLTVEQEIEIFAAQKARSDSILNDTNLYILTADVGAVSGDALISLKLPSSYPYSDNRLCLDGEVRFPSQPFTLSASSSDTTQTEEERSFAPACGTIDIDSNDGGGPMSFLLGLVVVLMLFAVKDIRDILLSKS